MFNTSRLRTTSKPFKLIALVIVLVFVTLLSACGKKYIPFGKSGSKTSSSTKIPKSGLAVCMTAKSQIGRLYKYGGSSPSTGFDCSGLIFWAYGKHGVSVPRNSKEQGSKGKSVSKKNLAPGDIILFKLPSGYHVGMYTGNGYFVHSPSSGKRIREDKVNNNYWQKYYKGARRYI